MRYLILIYGKESNWADVTPERASEIMAAYLAYTEQLKAAGVHVADDELQPIATAKSIRGEGGTSVVDGPYVDTKESLGGYYLIDAPSEAEARPHRGDARRVRRSDRTGTGWGGDSVLERTAGGATLASSSLQVVKAPLRNIIGPAH